MDISALARALGTDTVLTDPDALDARSHDFWPALAKRLLRGERPHRPDAVVLAGSEGDVRTVVDWASTAGVPVTPRGLGSAVTGAPVPVRGGIVLDLSGLTGMVELNDTDLTVTVRAGTRGADVEEELRSRGYTLGHSPQSLELSSVGGWLATRASGQFSSRYGSIEDLVAGFTAVLPTGETMRFPSLPRASTGPDLRQLFVGADGTLGVITSVTLKIFPVPEYQVVEAVRFHDVASGIEAMRAITRAGLRPFLVRLYDPAEAPLAMAEPGFAGCALFVGCEGVRRVAEAEQRAALRIAADHGGEPRGAAAVERWLEHRFDYAALEELLRRPGGVAETIEVAHRWSGILGLYHDLTSATAPLAGVLGHFSHVYPQGTSLYLIMLGDEADDTAAERRLGEIWETAMRVSLRHGAAIAHHHGVGLARLPYLREALGDSTVLLQKVKGALDPAGILNPGKLGSE